MGDKNSTPIDQSYYDEDYFEKGNKKVVDTNTGEERTFGYQGTDWTGNFFVVKGLLAIFQGQIGSILDVGAGQGSFTDYTIRAGLRGRGYDYADWAVAHPHNHAKGNLFQGDATNIKEEDGSWDVIFCSDMVEHIEKSRIDKVLAELHRVTDKWLFLQFPVANEEHEIFDAEIHDESHPLHAHFIVAGHLNMELRSWWLDKITSHGFKIRTDLETQFRAEVPRPVLANWLNIVVLEKV